MMEVLYQFAPYLFYNKAALKPEERNYLEMVCRGSDGVYFIMRVVDEFNEKEGWYKRPHIYKNTFEIDPWLFEKRNNLFPIDNKIFLN